MQTNFQAKWHNVRERQGSNIIAGVDPAVFAIGHGEGGLEKGGDLFDWAQAFIEATAPYVAGFKFNQAFFQGADQRTLLQGLVKAVQDLELLTISDNKFADIGNTNDAWIHYNRSLGFDAVTFAPYAGNVEAGIQSGHEQDIGICTLGLMSNPEYQSEMYFTDPESGESLWHARIRRALEAGADCTVVGGTYTSESAELAQLVALTKDSELLYLVPGIGAQGGTVESFLASGIPPEKCLISSSRGLMFPHGSESTPEAQAAAAKTLRDSFNMVAYA
ncbi:orotidine 5'-phosphate decarboxylase [Candidatus Pacebacteria bacterium]|nr:orotidine 5'-phosphate decarboxylase [Candidatus Paceibacterota bacterium]